MAEVKRTSRTLNYGLDAGTLRAIGAAETSKYFDAEGKSTGTIVGDAFTQLGKKAGAQAKIVKAEQKKKEDELKEEIEAKKKEMEKKQIDFDNSFFNKKANTWTNPRTFAQLEGLVEEDKQEYLRLLEADDKVGANRVLNNQNNKYLSLDEWKKEVLAAKDVWDDMQNGSPNGLAFSKSMSSKDKDIIRYINEQGEGTSIGWDDELGQYYFDVPEHGKVTLADYSKITSKLAPTDYKADFTEGLNAIETSVLNGQMRNFNTQKYYRENYDSVNEGNLEQLVLDDAFGLSGRSFAQDVASTPAIQNLQDKLITKMQNQDSSFTLDSKSLQTVKKLLGSEADDILDDEAIDVDEMRMLLSNNMFAEILPKLLLAKEEGGGKSKYVNFDLAKGFVAEYATLVQFNQFRESRTNYFGNQAEIANAKKSRMKS